MELTGKQTRYLRALAHPLKPVVLTGSGGVNDQVIAKVRLELENHELLKVKVNDGPMGVREAAPLLVEGTGAALVQIIGKTVVLYKRRKKEPEIQLPKE